MYNIYKAVYVNKEPTFLLRTDDDSEYDHGPDFIDQIFDFTCLFTDLGYWDSNTQLMGRGCDDALVQIRQSILRLQSEQITPRVMTAEERAYYRFPKWWFGQDIDTNESVSPYDRKLFSPHDRKKILMRHLLDLYNEIRAIPAFRSKQGERLFFCKYE